MSNKRIKIGLLILGFFMLPFLEITSIHPAMAEDFEPPTLSSEGVDGIDENVESLLQEAPPVTVNSHDTINSVFEQGVLDGQLPERVLPPGSVEVLLPASQPTGDESAITNRGDQSRPEGTYIIQQHINSISGPDILLLHADLDTDGDSPIQALLQAYGDLGDVDLFNARYATPTLAQLQDYQVVITWVNYEYANSVAIGNVLANYVDLGGKVINTNFSMGTYGWQMGGRFMTENYIAMNGTDILYSTQCLGDYNASSPIMFGITNVCDYWRIGGTYLTPDSSVVAEWGDGEVFVATKDDRSVVSINGYIGKQNYVWTGLMPDVVHNAIWWVYDTTSKGSFGWDNGPLVNQPGGGLNGANASVLQKSALGMNTYAFGNQFSLGNRMADDFEVTDPAGWQMDLVTFFAYQWGSTTTSTITGVYYQIWDGPPDNPASSVVFGDLTTNRLVNTYWSNIYRVLDITMTDDKNPIMTNVASAGVYLPPGTYWLDWMTDGSLTSGPWAPPISINGQTTTGNAMQYVGGWEPALDTGTATQQGMPFILQGYVPFSLWNQSLSSVNQNAYIDQQFPDLPTSNAYLADDFYVHTPWKIETIFIPGNGWNGFSTLMNASELIFMIYEDNGGVPAGDPEGGGAPPIWALGLPPSDPHFTFHLGTGGYSSNTVLTLPDCVTLAPGRYWLIMYPTMVFSSYGQFGRQPSDTTYGATGQLINPGGAWGWGTAWGDWTMISPANQDIAFRLGGTRIYYYLPLIMK